MQAFLHNKINIYGFIQHFICMLMSFITKSIQLVSSVLILITVYCLLPTDCSAQVYPVLVNTSLRGPYSLSLSDYATPAYDRIQANIYLADITKNNYPVKIRLVIRSITGINISTSPSNEVGPIYLDGGVNQTLTGSELYTLFDPNRLNFSGISYNQYRANGLPEGNYQFNFEVVDAQFGIVISNVNVGYANAWLILNDPPLINKPENGVTILPTLPQNIFFQWTPRHTGSPNAAFTTEYDVQLVEIYPAGANANDAMLTAPIIFEKTTFATAYNYSIADPNLIEGKWYAFRVRAHDQNGLDLFKNQGYSEVYSFYYGQPCSVPQGVTVEVTGTNTALVSWNQEDNFNSVAVEYKLLAEKNWKSIQSYTNSVKLDNLTPGAQYQVRVAGSCSNNRSEYSPEKILTLSGSVGTACSAPQYYNIERTELSTPNQKIKISWLPVPNVVSYSVMLQGNGIDKTYTKKSKDLSKNTGGQDLFATGTPTGDYFSIEDQIPNVPFTSTFEVTCADGSVTRGKTESVNLDISNLYASTCNLPQNTNVRAVAQSLTQVKVSWSTEQWFKSYKLRYRVLGSNAFFTEVTTADPFVVLTDIDLAAMYEYQVIYTCINGTQTVGSFNTFSVEADPSLFATVSTGDCFPPVDFSYEIDNGTATITWEKDKEIESYYLYWKEESASLWDSMNVRGVKAEITNLNIGSTYLYTIKPVCKGSGLLGIASTNGKFYVNAKGAPSPATCPTPFLKEPSATGSQEVHVEAEVIAAYTSYAVEIKLFDSNDQWMQMSMSSAQKLIGGLQPNTLYQYHIAAYCGTTKSDFSITDTIRTLLKDEEFSCGESKGFTILSSQVPIAMLSVNDPFTAADFDLKVKSLTSERPYNGEAIAKVPYLKNSSFVFQMQDVWVNEAGQMYAGKIFMKGTFLSILDPKLAAQIGSYIDKISDGYEKAQLYAKMGDSIITSMNDIVNTANKPIDWAKYEGWSAEQLYNEGKRLVSLANDLIKQGTPQSIASAKDTMIEGIELIKAAAAVTNSGVKLVSNKVKGWLKKALDTVQVQTDRNKIEIEKAQQTLDPVLTQSLNNTKDADAQKYAVLSDDEVFQYMDADSTIEKDETMDQMRSDQRLKDAFTNSESYVKNQSNLDIFNKILLYIKFYTTESNSKELVESIQKDMNATVNGRKLEEVPEEEMNKLLVEVEKSITKYLDDKAKTKSTTTK